MKSVIILGFGGRGINYANICKSRKSNFKVIGVCDISKVKLDLAYSQYNVSKEMLFSHTYELFSRGKIADYIFICTQDKQHYLHTMRALELGYDILLEKPISPDLTECIDIEKRAIELKRKVVICHVLRYTPFYMAIKRTLDNNILGDIISIEMIENVAYWHQAHSFVRGSWRNSEIAGPMILSKCCHDLDIAVWLADSECVEISSQGKLHHFKKNNAPQGATQMCLEGCKAKSECPYDAEKLYVDSFKKLMPWQKTVNSWPYSVITDDGKATLGKLKESIKDGPYGRCVYMCDNDVVDYQITQMKFNNGINCNLLMTAFSNECNREIRIRGSRGELTGNINANNIFIQTYGRKRKKLRIKSVAGGHGGGDYGLIKSLYRDAISTDITTSIMSHTMALASEHSRLNNGLSVSISKFKDKHIK